MRCLLLVLVVVVGLLGLGSCVDRGPGPERRKVAASYVREHLLAADPTALDHFDVVLGDQAVRYLGNTIDRPRIAPGQTVTITHYWKVQQPIGATWRPFALVRGPPMTADFQNLELTDMQVAYGPKAWKAGDIIEDVQTFTLRPDWRSPSATVLVGLIEVGRHGTLDRMATTGARTHDRAIIAGVLEVDLARAPPPPGTIHAPRAKGPIAIDGSGADSGWANAVTSPAFVTGEGSTDPIGKAIARLSWDDQFLYVFVTVHDSDIFSPYKQPDDPLWKADCIELFIDADGNRRGYIELQVSPNNVTFDSWFAGPRGSAGDVAWPSGMQTAVKVRGTGDKAGDTDQSWDAELAIPWAAVRGKDAPMRIHTPPKVGDRWRLNVVRVDKRSGSDKAYVSSWNRITIRDFHALDRLLTVIFADPSGSIVPVPDAAGPADPGTGSAAVPAGRGAGSAAPPTGSATQPASPPAGRAAPAAGRVTPPAGTLKTAAPRPTSVLRAIDRAKGVEERRPAGSATGSAGAPAGSPRRDAIRRGTAPGRGAAGSAATGKPPAGSGSSR